MAIRAIAAADVRDRLVSALGGDVGSEEVVAECLRRELGALGSTTRRVLVDRVWARLQIIGVTEREEVVRLVQQLEASGDVTRGPGGRLAAGPLRAVAVREGAEYLIVGCCSLEELLGDGLEARALTRGGLRRLSIAPSERQTFETRVADLGGRVITSEQWSGCDREPIADAAWIDRLNARVLNLPRPVPCAWERQQAYVPNQAEPIQFRRWKAASKVGSPALVRAKQPGGWFSYGWLVGDGESQSLLELSKHEAMRTLFALDRAAGAPLELPSEKVEKGVVLSLTALLPYPEYRLIQSHGEQLAGAGYPLRFLVPLESWTPLARSLNERLGLELPNDVQQAE
jgi:hypothetical protein